MKITPSMMLPLALVAGACFAGCASKQTAATATPARSTSSARVTSGTTTAADPAAPAASVPGDSSAAQKELDKLPSPTIVASKPTDTTFTVNAMIGQVNGRPIYASTVLEPLQGQLRAWSSTLNPRDFRMAASKLVADRVYQIVFDTLFLGEAERNLSEEERFGLKINLRMNRAELVRRYGAGSEPKADEEMGKKSGKGLEETLNNIKQTVLIRKYQDDVIAPKITVSRRDVERFYYDPANFLKFNPQPGRKFRMIRVNTGTQASEIERQLSEGKPFAEVAKERFNQFNRETGGLMVTRDEKDNVIDFIQGDKVIGIPALNDALIKLKAGQTSPRITEGSGASEVFWWVHLEEMNEGKQIPLRDAQLEIEQQIKGMQYTMLEQRYRKKLFEDAGYTADLDSSNPLADMTRSLVEIALNVYGPSAPKP